MFLLGYSSIKNRWSLSYNGREKILSQNKKIKKWIKNAHLNFLSPVISMVERV